MRSQLVMPKDVTTAIFYHKIAIDVPAWESPTQLPAKVYMRERKMLNLKNGKSAGDACLGLSNIYHTSSD